MTTTSKDFVVKNGLVVQGTQGTINGEVIVTEASLGTSLGDYIGISEKGNPDGVATLDENGQVPLDQLGNVSSGAGVTINDATPPTNPVDGQVWFDSSTGKAFIYYNDGNTTQWVEFVGARGPEGSIGPRGLRGLQGEQGIQGPAGADGADGAIGPANVLTIGTVTTGNPGDNAAASITGTSPSQTLNLTLPTVALANIPNSALVNSSITINGTAVSLGSSTTISSLPTQTGNSGKYLTTDGTSASWETVSLTDPIKLNIQTISANYTIPTGYNGSSAGPITIADGVTVTIADGSAWAIV